MEKTFFSTLILVGIIGLVSTSIKNQEPKDQLKSIAKITTGGVGGLLRDKIEKGITNNAR